MGFLVSFYVLLLYFVLSIIYCFGGHREFGFLLSYVLCEMLKKSKEENGKCIMKENRGNATDGLKTW